MSLDFDGCSDRDTGQEAIMQHIASTCAKYPSIEKIILMIGSLRQTLILDLYNAKGNSIAPYYISCTQLYDYFLPNLRDFLQSFGLTTVPSIEFNPFLLNDIYNHLSTGSTFNAMREVFFNEPQVLTAVMEQKYSYWIMNAADEDKDLLSTMDSHHMADTTKISLIYAQMHYLASAIAEPILFQFYDDRIDIISGLNRFYSLHQDLLPAQLCLELLLQETNQLSVLVADPIQGTGLVRAHYHEQIYLMSMSMDWQTIQLDFNGFKQFFDAPKINSSTVLHRPEYKSLPLPDTRAFAEDSPSNEEECYQAYQAIMNRHKQNFHHYCQCEMNEYHHYLNTIEIKDEYAGIAQLAIELVKTQRSICASFREQVEYESEFEALLSPYYGEERDNIRDLLMDYANKYIGFEENLESAYLELDHHKSMSLQKLANQMNMNFSTLIERMKLRDKDQEHLSPRYNSL